MLRLGIYETNIGLTMHTSSPESLVSLNVLRVSSPSDLGRLQIICPFKIIELNDKFTNVSYLFIFQVAHWIPA